MLKSDLASIIQELQSQLSTKDAQIERYEELIKGSCMKHGLCDSPNYDSCTACHSKNELRRIGETLLKETATPTDEGEG